MMSELVSLHKIYRPDFKLKSLSEIIADMLKQKRESIFLRTIPKDEARKLILDYIEKHPGCWTDEIFMNLRLDPILVFEVLRELEKEGLIEGKVE